MLIVISFRIVKDKYIMWLNFFLQSVENLTEEQIEGMIIFKIT